MLDCKTCGAKGVKDGAGMVRCGSPDCWFHDVPIPASVWNSSPAQMEAVKPPETTMAFPCNGPVKEWPLPDTAVAEWQSTYPGLDVLTECRKARQWCIDNPLKRKTARGMTKFLGGWLMRANDRGGASRPPSRSGYQSFRSEPANIPESRSEPDFKY